MTGLFFCACFTSFLTHTSFLTLLLFLCLISFLLFPCATVWENTYKSSSFPIVILNGTYFFPKVQLPVHNVHSDRKCRNT